MEKNVKFYYCHSIKWCILVERGRETEKGATFSGSVGHICQEKRDVQLHKLKNAHDSFAFLLSFNDCSSITIWCYQTCSSSFRFFSCNLSVGVDHFVFSGY